jgi:dTDP-4-amino-4,6-dideoxygalactose transaminase
MFKIIEDHKLKAVPVDVDIETLQPDIAALKSRINKNTRAVMLTHLFGAKIDIEPVREAIKNENILLIEDSSQYLYELNEDLRSDVKMNSFGTIKTGTALGGAILSVRDGGLFEELKKRYSDCAAQSEISYKVKVLKTMLLKFISSRAVFKMINVICASFKIDIDKMMYQATKSFTGSDFYDKIRMRPSKQLLLMLAKRLASHSCAEIDRHREECLKLNEGLSRRYLIPGIKAMHHIYWVCPVLSAELKNKTPYFRSENFFLSSQHGICRYGGAAGDLKNSETIINNVVYLPFYPQMPSREKKRLESLLHAD